MHLFERPCIAGWIYPCSLEDIASQLARLPEEDLAGLWAVGLVPSTRKDCDAYGRYLFQERPEIHICSYPALLRHKLRPHTKLSEIERVFAVDLQYGMRVERDGRRFICTWSAEDLRRFTLEHILLHEVGHHVYDWRRYLKGYAHCPSRIESEQFADAYALRYARAF